VRDEIDRVREVWRAARIREQRWERAKAAVLFVCSLAVGSLILMALKAAGAL